MPKTSVGPSRETKASHIEYQEQGAFTMGISESVMRFHGFGYCGLFVSLWEDTFYEFGFSLM